MRPGRLALAVVVLALAAGCSGGDPGDPENAPTPPTAPEVDDPGGTESDDLERPGYGGPLELEVVATGLNSPVHAAAPEGEPNRLYVVEQEGRVRVLEDGRLLGEPFLDIAGDVSSGGERGLLSIAFHPRYRSNGLFYVDYTDRNGDTRVKEFRAGGGDAPPAEIRELLFVGQPYANHNGGQLAFGPDGLLYAGTGDGGSSGDPENRAQDLSSRLGKLLRLDVDAPGAKWKMVGYGLRNPWRFSFDRLTGDLWIGDVGQSSIEEVNFVPARAIGRLFNFGWDVFEGTREFQSKTPTPAGTLLEPIIAYTHEFGCSVTGGFVYRGEELRQAWGRYFHGDYCSGRVWSVALRDGDVMRRGHPFRVPGLTSFGEDARGELYLLSAEGVVYGLAPRS